MVIVFQHHFKTLKQSGDKVRSYELYIDHEDATIAYSMKNFENEADLNAHNDSQELEVFLYELKKLLDDGADYHECTLIASL